MRRALANTDGLGRDFHVWERELARIKFNTPFVLFCGPRDERKGRGYPSRQEALQAAQGTQDARVYSFLPAERRS